MRELATGLVVIGLLLVCSPAFCEEVKTLEEWGVPPTSEWQYAYTNYWDDNYDGYEETVCMHYLVPEIDGIISTFRVFDESDLFRVTVGDNKAGTMFIYEDYDHDGLWTRRGLKE